MCLNLLIFGLDFDSYLQRNLSPHFFIECLLHYHLSSLTTPLKTVLPPPVALPVSPPHPFIKFITFSSGLRALLEQGGCL